MASLFSGNQTLFKAVTQYFEKDDWKFSQVEGKTILRLGFSGDAGEWTCFAQVKEDQDRFIFYSVAGNKVPTDKRMTVAEYLTRANYGLVLGNFEMDFSDGEVRYKTSIDVEGGKLSFEMWRNIVYANVLTMDKYMQSMMEVIYGGASPEDAVAKAES